MLLVKEVFIDSLFVSGCFCSCSPVRSLFSMFLVLMYFIIPLFRPENSICRIRFDLGLKLNKQILHTLFRLATDDDDGARPMFMIVCSDDDNDYL